MRRVGYLDGWRAISVSLVVLAHLGQFEQFAPYLPSGRYAIIGVQIFFAISGYVITRTLMAEGAQYGRISFKAFYVRRACRILPPLVLYLAVIGLLAFAGVVRHDMVATASAAGFICNTSLARCDWLVGHTWSLAFEEQFYLVFPSLLAIACWRQRVPALLLALFTVLALVPFLWPVGWIGRSGWLQTYLLLMGGALFAFHESGIRRALTISWLGRSVAVAVLAVVPVMEGAGALHQFARVILLPASILVLLFWTQGTAWARALSCAPIMYVGRISYSIYIWQQLPLDFQLDLSPGIRLACLAAVLGLAALSYEILERPFMRWGAGFSRRQVDNRDRVGDARTQPG